MSANYEAIRQKNIEEYGKGSRHLSYFSDIYTTRTHFIFEVLQNAEDALARRLEGSPAGSVQFHLHPDRLEIRHNGVPFTEFDVTGICGIGEGTKADDYTQIGKFGIGFKSVYAYSFFPQIHSGDEDFEIRRFVEPHAITSVDSNDTLIILPFDQPDKRPEWAFREDVPAADVVEEIAEALLKLSVRTLLFLRHIEDIKFELPDGTSGQFIRNSKNVTTCNGLRKLELRNQDEYFEEWLIFSRDVEVREGEKSHKVTVEVAFLVKDGSVIKANNTQLVVFFPTEKETKLGFLIQAPFKTTKSRDNIKADDSANRQMIQAAAQLAADSLETLRDMGLLNVASFNALPLSNQDFPKPANYNKDSSLFYPVYEKVREAIKTQPLLPAHGGGFIKVGEAKLARGKELVELFSPEQLGILFGKEPLAWLDASITESSETAEIHTYLIGRKKDYSSQDSVEPLVEGIQIDADALAQKLTADFLGKQTIEWLVKFVQYAIRGAQSLRKVPFIRLASGKQVSLPTSKEIEPTAWFAPKDISGLDLAVFAIVHEELAANDAIRNFLEKEGIREIDAVGIVGKCILPQYEEENKLFDESTYRNHLRQIRKAYTESNDIAKKQLTINLDNVAWLACIDATDLSSKNPIWKKPRVPDVFEQTDKHQTWFRGLFLTNAYFPHPFVIEELDGLVMSLVRPATTLTENLDSEDTTVVLSSRHSNHKWGVNGFNPDAKITGLLDVFMYSYNREKAIIIWEILLTAPRVVSGETQKARNQQQLNAAKKVTEYTEVGNLCREHKWLPDKAGNLFKPDQLFLSDLPEDFETTSIRAKEVADKLGMKKPEAEQAAEELAKGNPRKKQLLEAIANASDDELDKYEKFLPKTLPPAHVPSFQESIKNMMQPQHGTTSNSSAEIQNHPINNPNRYQDNINQAVVDAVKQHENTPQSIRFSPVRERPSNQEARNFLYEQYQGYCQITGNTFPKASANAEGEAENYFEACSLVSYSYAEYLNDAGNTVCVSADTMAKLKNANFEWLDNLEEKIELFKNREPGEIETVKVKVRLAGQEQEITWSERHFRRLVALWDNA
ncbi:MAG: hypothetical protein PHE55_07945 [Methylococcaceae bacterium]|nr:hypothetical protein [Methylococcaceae bacterium]